MGIYIKNAGNKLLYHMIYDNFIYMDKGGDQMIQETINVVKETEEKAEKIVKDARQQADAMVQKPKKMPSFSKRLSLRV